MKPSPLPSTWIAAANIAIPFIVLVGLLVSCTVDVEAIGGVGGSDFGSTVGITTGVSVAGSTASSGGTECTATSQGKILSMSSSASTGGGATSCTFASKDEALHVFLADCTPEGCKCLVDGVGTCSCQFAAPTACDTSCCAPPWPQKL